MNPRPEPLAYVNGRTVPLCRAALALNDIGFVWGATVTDLSRTIRHCLYCWDDHLSRFRRHCLGVGIDLPVSDDELTSRAEELVAHNTTLIDAASDLSLVLCATPGTLGYYVGAAENGPATLVMQTFPIPFRRYAPLHQRGARLAVPGIRQVPANSVDPRLKQRSRMHWWLAEQEVRRLDPGASALLLDDRGFVTETAAASLLVVRDGKVWTPRRECILESVSLEVVAWGCRELGLELGEADLTLQDVQAADEALLANSNFCLAGVSSVAGRALPWPGPVFERLLAWWSAAVGWTSAL